MVWGLFWLALNHPHLASTPTLFRGTRFRGDLGVGHSPRPKKNLTGSSRFSCDSVRLIAARRDSVRLIAARRGPFRLAGYALH